MKKIIALNLKMNQNYDDAKEYIKTIKDKISDKHDIIIFPSFVHLDLFKDSGYPIGAQNVYTEDKGAFTGEVSPLQLKSQGISNVIVGHSERRHILMEDDEMINKKLKGCFRNNLKVILCIGETSEQRSLNKTEEVLESQLRDDLKDVSSEELTNITIAYEPVWSIGTGHTPTLEEIDEAMKYIANRIESWYGVKPSVLYGGSVNQENIVEILGLPSVDGALVGTASINPHYLLTMLDMVD